MALFLLYLGDGIREKSVLVYKRCHYYYLENVCKFWV